MRQGWLWLVVLAACGSSDDDGGSDAVGVVTVSVRASNAGVASTLIVFQDRDGTQVATLDGAGIASATVRGPTQVSHVSLGVSTVHSVTSIEEVMPGETIAFHLLREPSQPAPPMMVSFVKNAASTYQLCGPCECVSPTASPATLPMQAASCAVTPFELTLVENDGGGLQRYTTVLIDAATYAAGSTTIAAPSIPVETFTATFPVVPAMVGRFMFRFDDNSRGQMVYSAEPPTSPTTIAAQGWRRKGASLLLAAYADGDDPGAQFFQTIADEELPAGTAFEIDIEADLLPWVSLPTFDASTLTVTIPMTGGTTADLQRVQADYRVASGAVVFVEVFGPPSSSIRLPPLPADVLDLTAFDPAAMEYPDATLYDVASVDGYAAARLDPFALVSWLPGYGRRHESGSARL